MNRQGSRISVSRVKRILGRWARLWTVYSVGVCAYCEREPLWRAPEDGLGATGH